MAEGESASIMTAHPHLMRKAGAGVQGWGCRFGHWGCWGCWGCGDWAIIAARRHEASKTKRIKDAAGRSRMKGGGAGTADKMRKPRHETRASPSKGGVWRAAHPLGHLTRAPASPFSLLAFAKSASSRSTNCSKSSAESRRLTARCGSGCEQPGTGHT